MVADFFQFKHDLNAAAAERMRFWLDGWALPHLANVSDFGEAITRVGFQNVECDDITANVLAARHQYTTMRDGLWGYSVFTARKPSS